MKIFKKFIYLFIFSFSLFFMLNSVYADDITCTLGGRNIKFDEKIPDTIHIVILVIQIAIPILLVIFGSIDFVKALTSGKEDEIKKGQQTFIKRLIAGVIVFFIVAIVKLLITFAAGEDASDIIKCADCFFNGTKKCELSNPLVNIGSNFSKSLNQ